MDKDGVLLNSYKIIYEKVTGGVLYGVNDKFVKIQAGTTATKQWWGKYQVVAMLFLEILQLVCVFKDFAVAQCGSHDYTNNTYNYKSILVYSINT